MTYFLKPERRAELIHVLADVIGMPRFAAELIASYEDDVATIDERLEHHTNSSMEWAETMVTAKHEGNNQTIEMMGTYMLAEIAIIAAYREEGAERGLKGTFPRWLAAAQKAKDALPSVKAELTK
jgi:hypothetical protein